MITTNPSDRNVWSVWRKNENIATAQVVREGVREEVLGNIKEA